MHHLGSTRSGSRREYLLHTPDAFVPTPMPGMTDAMAIVHIGPQLGAAFAMTTVVFEPGGTVSAAPVQRFVYVLEGDIELREPGGKPPSPLKPGGFAFLPPASPHTLSAKKRARMLVMEKAYKPLPPAREDEPLASTPGLLVGHEDEVEAAGLNGDLDVRVRPLLPASLAFDFAVNLMTYAPGASLAQVEVHWMEHGLLMLSGGGVYRLGQDWHPVTAGDAIWMAPFCPQWFAAVGKTPARYLIYKDFNRHVLS